MQNVSLDDHHYSNTWYCEWRNTGEDIVRTLRRSERGKLVRTAGPYAFKDRKKSKCTGEKPECSFCVRLGQRCMYARHDQVRTSREEHLCVLDEGPPMMAPPDSAVLDVNRLSVIEGRLEQLAAAINLQRTSVPSYSPTESASDRRTCGLRPISSSTTLPSLGPVRARPVPIWPSEELQLPDALISEGINLYFSNHCNQPCPILAHCNPSELCGKDCLPQIVLYPMLALSLRSSRHSLLGDHCTKRQWTDQITAYSWTLLTKAYCDTDLNDDYLQGLCLLAQVDSGDQRFWRAQMQVASGLRLAQSRGMLSTDSLHGLNTIDSARRKEIVWSLFMLDRMLLGGHVKNTTIPLTAFELPLYEGDSSCLIRPSNSADSDTSSTSRRKDELPSLQSAVSLNVQIMGIWERVATDIICQSTKPEVPLWKHDSPCATIMTELLDFETNCQATGHNLSSTGSPVRVLEEPQLQPFFLVWLQFQIILCAIQCCLNHPFIIYVKTIKLKHRVPFTYLQKSNKYAVIHANWVFRLLNEMNDAGLAIHDPFIGHLVAIAATIHLEYTLSQHAHVADSAKHKFVVCLNFVKQLSGLWPNMSVAAHLLEQLRSRTRHRSSMNYTEEEFDGQVPPDAERRIVLESEDMDLMRQLFDYTSVSTKPNADLESRVESTPEMSSQHQGPIAGDLSSTVEAQSQEYQDGGLNMPNFVLGGLSAFGIPDASSNDWSLFGGSWME